MNRKIVFSVSVLVVVVLTSLFFLSEIKQHARMETNLDAYMPSSHPAFVYSDQAEEWFSINDGILIAIENPKGIYNAQTLTKLKDMSLGLQDMPEFEATDITSLYTADNILGTEYGLDVHAFYEEIPTDSIQWNALRQQIRDNDMAYGRVVSNDETVVLIAAGMRDSLFTDDFYQHILTYAKSFEGDGDRIYVAGRPIVEGTMGQLGPKDMKKMIPIVIIVITLILYLVLRSIRATAATLGTVFISTVWVFGLMAASGIPIYAVSTMIPVMLIAIGVAYGIYFFNHLKQYTQLHPEGERSKAVRYVLRVLHRPLTMAAFTTMIGFLSLLTSEVYPIKYFGLFTAFGILVVFLLALVFIPACILLFGYKPSHPKKTNKQGKKNGMETYTNRVLLHRKAIYSVVIALAVLSIYGTSNVWINSSFLANFEKDSEIVQTDVFVNSKFGGTSTLNVVLESSTYDAFKQSEVLSLMDEMQTEAEGLQYVGNSFSLADYLKRMHRVMNANDEAFYHIPESKEMIAQYLLLYEMSGDPENLGKVVNYDYNRSNVTFQLKGDDTKTIQSALTLIETYRNRFLSLGIDINYAGSGYKALVFTDLILDGQIKSILLSLLLVFILLSLLFRDIKAGLAGTLPIILTALISFGVMGLFNIPLSTTTALLSSIAIGIGIDYAIHFLEHYKTNQEKNERKIDALHQTMQQTGKAILFNAWVVIAGFLVLLFSVFPPNRTLGALVSLNMFTSLAGTLSLLMIVVYQWNIFKK
ncbi:MAG: RND family transporter [Bacteroidales bacterium]